MTAMRIARRLAGAAATALVLAACGGADAPATPDPETTVTDTTTEEVAPDGDTEEPLRVVVTTSILGDVVGRLVGDDADVRVLMAPGVDPHGYQASAADAAALRDADLVVANGLMLEEGLVSALDAAVDEGVRVIELAPELNPIAFDEAHDDEHDHGVEDHDEHDHDQADDHGDDDHDHGDDHSDDEHADHDHGELDPHFWFDPLRMADGVDAVASALTDVRPEVDWQARADASRAELEALDAELVDLFATIPPERRRLVTNHDSLGYLAERYGLKILGTVVPGASTSVESNPQAFARLVDLLVAEDVDVIFAETTDTTTLADALASEVIGRSDLDVTVVPLYTGSLGEPGSGADTYVGMLRTTATLIVDALAG